MNKQLLAQQIYQTSNIQGNFTLRSQQRATEYFDKYLFEAQPKLLSQIAHQLISFIPKNIDVLAGLEMGGIPIATALSGFAPEGRGQRAALKGTPSDKGRERKGHSCVRMQVVYFILLPSV